MLSRVEGKRLVLRVLHVTFGVCRLDAGAVVPSGLLESEFFSITRTPEELSIVAPEEELSQLPAEARIEGGWTCLKVEGPLDLSLTGVLATLSGTLARAGVALFAISTYDTDYLLIKNGNLDSAISALSKAGHTVEGPAGG